MKKSRFLAPVAALCLMSSPAMATYMADISYTATDNGGGNYTFNFKVENTSDGASSGALDFFSIDFDADTDISLYSNITWVADNSWYSEAAEYDSGFGGIPANVLADDSVFGSGGGGIAQGASLGGFKVSFDYSGALGVSDQLFSFIAEFGTSDSDNGGIEIDPDGDPGNGDEYWILGEYYGTTTYVAAPQPQPGVPEPGVVLLLGSGLLGMLGVNRRRRG